VRASVKQALPLLKRCAFRRDFGTRLTLGIHLEAQTAAVSIQHGGPPHPTSPQRTPSHRGLPVVSAHIGKPVMPSWPTISCRISGKKDERELSTTTVTAMRRKPTPFFYGCWCSLAKSSLNGKHVVIVNAPKRVLVKGEESPGVARYLDRLVASNAGYLPASVGPLPREQENEQNSTNHLMRAMPLTGPRSHACLATGCAAGLIR
jgi:hypothetical protein